jgi:SAM-dependent MidA family methyltransferase
VTDVIKKDNNSYHYNVTRCKYAEMYKEMGIQDLGFDLSCNRDFNLVEGFNKNIKLKRTKTLMQGDDYCDFRYDVND